MWVGGMVGEFDCGGDDGSKRCVKWMDLNDELNE
jgi:hypothetical protein